MGGAIKDTVNAFTEYTKQITGFSAASKGVGDLMPKPPQMPQMPQLPPSFVEGGAAADAGDRAAKAQKRKNQALTGPAGDKLTGPQGLGDIPKQNQERKTLLGY